MSKSSRLEEPCEIVAGSTASMEQASGRKMKGMATVKLSDGTICEAELHWYEAHGIGKKEIKFKRPIGDR